MQQFMHREYWETESSKRHLVGRLVAFNKKFPEMPGIADYRPIIVLSPVVKFLEGLIIGALRRYSRERLSEAQYGFVAGLGVEDAKESVMR